MFEKTCDKKSEHDEHYHTVELTKTCDGKASCGAWAHSAHSFTVKEQAICYGVCRCSYVSHPHSPKKHPSGRRVDPVV